MKVKKGIPRDAQPLGGYRQHLPMLLVSFYTKRLFVVLQYKSVQFL